jgi:ketosteroid isomerase-like protein
MQQDRKSVALSYWEHECRGDIDGVLRHFAPDAKFAAPSVQLRGRGEIRSFYERMGSSYAEMQVSPRGIIESGDDLVIEFTFRYLKPGGERGSAEGCNVFNIRDGLIRRLRAYFDPADF